MNDEQYKRFRKMNSERIICLFSKIDSNATIHFLISGSSGTRYKVSIITDGKSAGKITCSCPDFSTGAKTQECVCKHCLFVIYNVLELFNSVNHSFFKRLYFTPDEIKSIKRAYNSSLLRSRNKK